MARKACGYAIVRVSTPVQRFPTVDRAGVSNGLRCRRQAFEINGKVGQVLFVEHHDLR